MRRRIRGQIGPLARLRVAPGTYRRYHDAASRFLLWLFSMALPLATSIEELDQQLCWYIEHLWSDGEGRNMSGDTLSAVSFFLHRRRIFQGAWGLHAAWGRAEIPDRAPPLSVEVLWAFCGIALSAHRYDICALLCLGFHGILRTEEILSARTHQFTLSAEGRGVMALPWTKSGMRKGAQEFVTIDDLCIGRLLLRMIASVNAGSLLLQGSQHEFRQFFCQAAARLLLPHVGYRPYSLRRGGATHDYLTNRSLSKTVVRGRWSDQRIARVYINDGLAVQTQLSMSEPSKALVSHFGQRFLEFMRTI